MRFTSLATSTAKLLVAVALVTGLAFAPGLIPSVQAQITNPAIGALGANTADTASGAQFVGIFVGIWRSITIVGALAVIIYFIWGSVDWITAGGEAGKIQKARDKMVNAVIGLILLVSSFVIIGFISQLFFGQSFDILRLDITGVVNNTGTTGTTGGTGSGGAQPNSNGSATSNHGTIPNGQCAVRSNNGGNAWASCASGTARPHIGTGGCNSTDNPEFTGFRCSAPG
jgi:hypothetical protein